MPERIHQKANGNRELAFRVEIKTLDNYYIFLYIPQYCQCTCTKKIHNKNNIFGISCWYKVESTEKCVFSVHLVFLLLFESYKSEHILFRIMWGSDISGQMLMLSM